MKCYLYVLRSLKDNKLYIGISYNPIKRLLEHNIGKNISTRFRRPFKLIFTKEFNSKKEALRYEWYVKNTGKGNIELKNLLPR